MQDFNHTCLDRLFDLRAKTIGSNQFAHLLCTLLSCLFTSSCDYWTSYLHSFFRTIIVLVSLIDHGWSVLWTQRRGCDAILPRWRIGFGMHEIRFRVWTPLCTFLFRFLLISLGRRRYFSDFPSQSWEACESLRFDGDRVPALRELLHLGYLPAWYHSGHRNLHGLRVW